MEPFQSCFHSYFCCLFIFTLTFCWETDFFTFQMTRIETVLILKNEYHTSLGTVISIIQMKTQKFQHKPSYGQLNRIIHRRHHNKKQIIVSQIPIAISFPYPQKVNDISHISFSNTRKV